MKSKKDDSRMERINRWKDKLKMTIDNDGNVLYGWGYPQSAHLDVLNKLNANSSGKVDLDEVLRILDDETGQK